MALLEIVARKGHHQHGVGRRNPQAHDRAHQGGDAQGGEREIESPDHARQGAGQRRDDDERVEPALEIDDQQQVDERDRQPQPDAEAGETGVHRIRLPAQHDEAAPRQFLFRLFDQGLDVSQHPAQVAAAHAAKDIDHRHHIVMGIDGRAARCARRRRGWQGVWGSFLPGWLAFTGIELSAAMRIHRILRDPDVHEILDAVFRVEPVVGLHLTAAAKAHEHRVGHVALGQADLGCLGAVDGKVELGLVGGLLHTHVNGSGHLADFLGESCRDGPALVAFPAYDLDIEGSRQSEIDRLVYDIGRQEIEGRSRKVAVEPGA